MRTTIDIPEDLLRRVKAVAALRGVKLKDLVANLLEQGLDKGRQGSDRLGQGRPIPITIPADGQNLPALSKAEIEEIFLQEDLERLGLNRSA